MPLEPFRVAYHGRKPFRSAHKPPLSTRYLPLVASLRGYSRSRLRTDALAGVTVAALALPASMAYADIAGLPVTAGLYSLLLPLVVYALLGSAPWLVVGPESTIALLVAAGLAPLAVAGTAEYTTLAAALALGGRRGLPGGPRCCGWAGSPTTSPKRSSSATSPASRS